MLGTQDVRVRRPAQFIDPALDRGVELLREVERLRWKESRLRARPLHHDDPGHAQ